MSRTLTTASRAAMYARETSEVFLALAELTHPAWPDPIRLVNDEIYKRSVTTIYRTAAEDGFAPAENWAVTYGPSFTTVTAVDPAGAILDVALLDQQFEATLPNRRVRVEARVRPSLTGTPATTVTLGLRTRGGVQTGATAFSLSSGWQVLTIEANVPANATDGATQARFSAMGAGTSLDIDEVTYTRLPTLVSNGQVYTALGFQVAMPDDEDTAFPKASFVADNVGLEVLRQFRQVQSPVSATIRFVLASDPDAVIHSFAGEITELTADAQSIQGSITPDPVMEMEWSRMSFDPTHFPGLF